MCWHSRWISSAIAWYSRTIAGCRSASPGSIGICGIWHCARAGGGGSGPVRPARVGQQQVDSHAPARLCHSLPRLATTATCLALSQRLAPDPDFVQLARGLPGQGACRRLEPPPRAPARARTWLVMSSGPCASAAAV